MYFVCFETRSLYIDIHGCPGTHYEDQAGLKLIHPPLPFEEGSYRDQRCVSPYQAKGCIIIIITIIISLKFLKMHVYVFVLAPRVSKYQRR